MGCREQGPGPRRPCSWSEKIKLQWLQSPDQRGQLHGVRFVATKVEFEEENTAASDRKWTETSRDRLVAICIGFHFAKARRDGIQSRPATVRQLQAIALTSDFQLNYQLHSVMTLCLLVRCFSNAFALNRDRPLRQLTLHKCWLDVYDYSCFGLKMAGTRISEDLSEFGTLCSQSFAPDR